MGEPDTSRESVERLAEEREEKAAESFLMVEMLRAHDRDPTGYLMAAEYAAKTAATLRALLARAERAEAERDAAVAAEREACAVAIDTLRSSGWNTDDWTITRDLAFDRAVKVIRARGETTR